MPATFSYGPHERQALDVYGTGPVVVWLHGGGWLGGDKAAPGAIGYVTRLLDHGYAVVAANYRLSGDATWPAQRDDVAAVVEWVRSAGPGLGLDAARVALWGWSAGAHLALDHAVTAPDPVPVACYYPATMLLTLDAELGANGCDGIVFDTPGSPVGLLLGGKPSTLVALAEDASPALHLDSLTVPVLSLHGQQDCTLPWQQTLHLAGSPLVDAVFVPTGGHGPGIRNRMGFERVVAFLDGLA